MDISDILRAVLQGAQAQGGASAGHSATQPGQPPHVPGRDLPFQAPQAHEGGGGGGHGGVSAPPANNPTHGTSHHRAANMPSQAQSSSGSAGDVLGSILGGTAQQPGVGSAGGSGPLGAILGGILGGDATRGGSAASSADPISAILGALMGGSGQSPQTTNSGDILGSVLGSQDTNAATNGFLAPIANVVAQKLNIPPEVAASVVNYAISKLIAAHASGGNHGAFAVDHLMEHLNSEGGVDHDFALSTGAAQELAQRTGLDEHTAASALQTAFNEIGTRASTP